jgi:hypothetical protein
MRIFFLGLSFALVLSIVAASAVTEHPGVGFPSKLKLTSVYVPGATDASISINELTFGQIKKPRERLTPEEIYIVGGSKQSNFADRRSLSPWATDVITMVFRYYKVHNKVPEILDDTAIRSIPYYEKWPSGELDLYRNPFSGSWPRLNATVPVPGDMYVRQLNDTEMRHFAKIMAQEEAWFGNGPGQHLCGPVLYQRVYGTDGPIIESIPHILCGPMPSP